MRHVNTNFGSIGTFCGIFEFNCSISSTWIEPTFGDAILVFAYCGCDSFDSFAV
jgi:hypothetical protein